MPTVYISLSVALDASSWPKTFVHLITCICYNKVLSCEVDHIDVISQSAQSRTSSQVSRSNNNKIDMNWPQKIITGRNFSLMYCVIAMLLHSSAQSIFLQHFQFRALPVDRSVVCAVTVFLVGTLASDKHNLTHLSFWSVWYFLPHFAFASFFACFRASLPWWVWCERVDRFVATAAAAINIVGCETNQERSLSSLHLLPLIFKFDVGARFHTSNCCCLTFNGYLNDRQLEIIQFKSHF